MLRRAARCRIKAELFRHGGQASSEQLLTPWLAPNVAEYIKSQARPGSPRPHTGLARAHVRTTLEANGGKGSTRYLATEATSFDRADDYIPFEGLGHDLTRPYRQQEWGNLKLNYLDVNDVVILPSSTDNSPPLVKRGRNTGLSGDTALLQENVYALIGVGRLDQAAKVVRNMAKIFQPDASELLDAHHRYLTGLLESLLADPSNQKFVEMQKWFELDMRGQGVQPNGAVLAIMAKASFEVLEGYRLQRTIRRYIGVAQELGSDVHDDMLSSSILLESEFDDILRMFPQEFESPMENVNAEQDFKPPETHHLDPLPQKPTSGSNDMFIPDLRPIEQKGTGLKAVKNSIASLTADPQTLKSSLEKNKSIAYERQRALEKDVLASALEKWHEEAEDMRAHRSRVDWRLGAFAHQWTEEMAALVEEELKGSAPVEDRKLNEEDVDRALLRPFLELVPSERMCAAAILSCIHHITDRRSDEDVSSRSLVSTVSAIGGAISKEIESERVKKNLIEKFHSMPSRQRKAKIEKLLRNPRDLTRASKALNQSESATKESLQRPTIIPRIKLGAMFLSFLMKVAKIPVARVDPETGQEVTQNQPVIINSSQWKGGKRHGTIKVHPEVLNKLKREPVASFIAKYLPMVVPPKPWKGIERGQGPYLETNVQAVRVRDSSSSQNEYTRMATQRGDMKQTFAALDVIGKVPWRINNAVFNVLAEVWNSGQEIGGLAPAELPENWPEKPQETDALAFYKWKQAMMELQNLRSSLHSQRCYQNFQFEVARAYLNETFYCPHNLDFRGRAYPIPPYFNHIGPDYVRALFMFAQGKELGETGLRWLKIHLANVYGYDKASLKDRETFAMDHLTDIYDSAENPLKGNRWWLTSDDPWQTLAACMELRNALKSPQPEKFVSHIPVQQDGTCNGLQHYAALGGDAIGAQQVNLMPGDKPADIYSAVAELVQQDVSIAAANGDKAAQVLEGKISRKVVKQPVMTNVYGVTYHGAMHQVKKRLLECLPKASLEDKFSVNQLSSFVAGRIFKALSSMFNGAHAIQEWLGVCGGRISSSVTPEQVERIKAKRDGILKRPSRLKVKQLSAVERNVAKEDYQFKSTIVWTTPLGMPVVQPYRKPHFKRISTNFQEIFVEDSTLSDPVSKRKQLQGFPPNFIHSLDATHMMLSALKCDELGLLFSAVHDSFWTHASDVPVMNRILRDAFVRMHSEDVVGRLRDEFMARYKGCMWYAAVDVRSNVGKKILNLRRDRGTDMQCFMGTSKVKDTVQIDELLEECERLRLLQSDDPDEVLKGREMITPGSIFEAGRDRSSFVYDREAYGKIALLGEPQGTPEQGEISGMQGDLTKSQLPDLEESNPDGFDAAVTDVDLEQVAGIESNNSTDAKPTNRRKRNTQHSGSKLHLWLPIEFPETPQRGEFDVTKLKDSQYFFS